jgi:hypothetical protein
VRAEDDLGSRRLATDDRNEGSDCADIRRLLLVSTLLGLEENKGGRKRERRRTLRIIDNSYIQPAQWRPLPTPQLLIVVLSPFLEKLLVVVGKADVFVGDTLEDVLFAREKSEMVERRERRKAYVEFSLGDVEDARVTVRDEPADVETGRVPEAHEGVALYANDPLLSGSASLEKRLKGEEGKVDAPSTQLLHPSASPRKTQR